MIYFETKSDRKFMESFLERAEEYLEIKNSIFQGDTLRFAKQAVQKSSQLRTQLSRDLFRANNIASKYEINVVCIDRSTGNQFNALEEITRGDYDGVISSQNQLDLINETIGACSEIERRELKMVVNPFFWVQFILEAILKFPFWVLQTAGFKTDSFEKSLAGSLIRFINIIVVIALLVYFGFSDEELKAAIKSMVERA